ncbi:TonB-dependent receptor [Stenotrophomonas sp. W1S232]|uniref:TonB-dependent receptor n=1 Tax=Stenotrophomonas koreensis TaxID=266128 RepID=A0A7W3UZW1_9GAMM|nr:TonB-dependent receptor [Stenotrophomonas koreensis]MBB1116879.1 TonB-dependent receptor [Stenotrophomonas koreensis]
MSYKKSFHRLPSKAPLTLALSAALMLPMAHAVAQDADTTEESKTAQAADAATLDRIVVTGSRIAKDTFNAVSPVQVITREETTVAGFASTTGVLQSNAVTGGSDQINNAYGGYVVNGGPGVNTLSLRGLGPTRTLMLMNGRRIAPAGSRGAVGSADLNVLPSIMISHIEVLKDGASSIYGSDAVAGVVNVVTQNKLDGGQVEFQVNVPEHGGGEEMRWSGMFGTSGDSWRVSGSLDIYDRKEIQFGQRGWASDCPREYYGRNADGSYGADDFRDPVTGEVVCWGLDAGGVTIGTLGTANAATNFFAPGSVGSGANGNVFNRWRPNAAATGSPIIGFEGVDYYTRTTYEPEMEKESLISPTTNVTGFLQGAIDVPALGNTEAYFEVLAHRRESEQNGYLQHTVDYAVGSPLLGQWGYLPAFLLAPADGSTNGRNVAARAFIGWGLYRNWQEVDFTRATAGLRGELGAGWNYDGYVSFAKSDSDYYTENRLTDRIAKAYDVVADGRGGFVCRDTSDGCVAAPVLSYDVVNGVLPQAYRDYIMQVTHGQTEYTEKTFSFGVNGPLFDMPWDAGGTVRGAFGVEYRGSEIDDTPDANSINSNLYGFTSSTPTRGKDNVQEAYAEVELPLLSGVTGAEELTLNGSVRYTDYDSYGSDKTWKLGLLYTPVSWLSIRASRGTSFRAPALFEQFLGATSGFTGSSGDPCNDWGASNDTSSNRYLNCQSLGLDPNFQQTSSITVLTKGGAETGLAAETSTSLTAGIVLQPEMPSWFGDLSIAADYYDVQVDNGVARLTGGQVLSLCYGQSPAEFTAGTGYCGLVQRDANNGLRVTTGYVNVATDIVRGWDFTVRYTRDIGPGQFRANAVITSFLEQSGKTFPDDPFRDSSGTIGSPEKTGQLNLTYALRNWSFNYGLDWVEGINGYEYYEKYNDVDYRPFYQMMIDDHFISNASVQYRGDDWTVTAGVRNLADKDPPVISSGAYTVIGNAPLYSGYDMIGRSYHMTISKKF